MIVSDTTKVGFVHVPKCAGTSITQWLLETGKDFREISNKHWTPSHLPRQFREKYQWFAVVRNPYERLVSHYNFHVRYYENRMKNSKLSQKPKYSQRYELLKKGFDRWCLDPYQIANREPHWYDYRWTPQVMWIDDHTKVLKYENLAEDFEWVQQTLGDSRELPVLNSTKQDSRAYREYFKTPEVRQMADYFFEPDCLAFGYRF